MTRSKWGREVIYGIVNYASTTPPRAYRCSVCDAHGVRLWRQYNIVASAVELMCCDCAALEEGKVGKWEGTDDGDQIGSMIPAVPTKEGDSFWGYTSVPQNGCNWWYSLPMRVDHRKESFKRARDVAEWIRVRMPRLQSMRDTAGGLAWAFKHWRKANVRTIKFKKPWSYPKLGYRMQVGPKVFVGCGIVELYWVIPGYEKEAEEM